MNHFQSSTLHGTAVGVVTFLAAALTTASAATQAFTGTETPLTGAADVNVVSTAVTLDGPKDFGASTVQINTGFTGTYFQSSPAVGLTFNGGTIETNVAFSTGNATGRSFFATGSTVTKTGSAGLTAQLGTFSGGTYTNAAGTTTMNQLGSMPTQNFVVSGGSLNFGAGNDNYSIGNLSGTGGNVTVGFNSTNNTRTFVINQSQHQTLASTVIGASGNTGRRMLVKQGTASLRLTGANTYSVGTRISAGSWIVDGSHTASQVDSGYFVANGGTLGGAGTIATNTGLNLTRLNTGAMIAVASGGILAPGSVDGSGVSGVGALTLDAANSSGIALTMEAGATFSFDLSGATGDQISLANGGAGDFVFSGNTINFNVLAPLTAGTTYTLFTAFDGSAYSGLSVDGSNNITGGLVLGTGLEAYAGQTQFRLDGGNITLTVVPEPTQIALLTTAFLALALILRRQRRTT